MNGIVVIPAEEIQRAARECFPHFTRQMAEACVLELFLTKIKSVQWPKLKNP